MDNHQHNIIIVGSGLVGMTLALMLSRQQYKVLILDKSSKKELLEVKDTRTSAISQGSSRILKEISIWNKIKNKNKILIAYEPVWSIGTGLIPKNNELFQIINFIKTKVKKNKVLYGGSVNQKNIHELKSIENVDGFLIGGASQKTKKFIDIIKKTYN